MDPFEAECRAMGARLMNPSRPQLDAALALAAECAGDPRVPEAVRARGYRGDPRQLWEALATRGLIPDAWVGDTTRRFGRGARGHTPPSVDAAVTLAADPAGVMQAEAFAREVVARLAAWRLWLRDEWVIEWRFVTEGALRNGVVGTRGVAPTVDSTVASATIYAAYDDERGRPRLPDAGEVALWLRRDGALRGLERAAAATLDLRRCWRYIAERGCTVTPEGDHDVRKAFARTGNRSYASLPNPYEPAVDVWKLGYAFRGVREEGVITLEAAVAPGSGG